MNQYLQIRPSNQRPDESMTSSKPTNQREARERTIWFELVKVNSHQSVIIWRFNSTTNSAAVERKSEKCRECTAGHLLRNVINISSITPAKLNVNRHHVWSTTASASKQRRHRWIDQDNCDQQVILLHLVNRESSDIIRTLDKSSGTVNCMRAYERSSTFVKALSSSS